MPNEKLIMKLIATERNKSTKLSFSIEPVNRHGDYESPEFNIHNMVDICFLMTKDSSGVKYSIAKKKDILAKDLIVKLDVCMTVGEKNRSQNVLCTEEWSEWQLIHINQFSSITHFEILVDLTVSKVDSTIMKLYNDEEFTDFQLSTAEGCVAVHKAQLAANSEVFKTMLLREWKETTVGRINMKGVTLQTLQHLKDYMYLGTLPGDGLCPLLQLSMCYMIDNLKVECLMKLAQTVTAENLYDILAYSFINNIPELTFAVLGAMPKSIVEDARQIMIESQKSCMKAEADQMAEQEESNEYIHQVIL